MSDTINLANSIWPNGMIVDSDGYAVFNDLGTDKIPVPTNTSDWPEGDELISPFVYKNKTLVGFVDTKAMTVDNPTTITLDYNRIEADFSSIEEGMLTITAPNATTTKYVWANSSSSDTGNSGDTITFKYKGCTTLNEVKAVDPDYLTNDIVDGAWTESLADLEQACTGQWGGGMFWGCTNLTSFSSDLSSLTSGDDMFWGCTNLTSFSSSLPKLTSGDDMFYDCTSLTSFNVDLSTLTSGNNMFKSCTNLTTFSSDLSSLTYGSYMFQSCTNLTAFNIDLSSLTNGERMFHDCFQLTTFDSDLSSLTNGDGMFNYCLKLNSFSSDLSSLTNGNGMFYGCSNLTSLNVDLPNLMGGYEMFYGCKLDTASVQHIADTINTASKSKLDIGIGNPSPNEQEVAAFNTMVSKGWIVFVNSNYYGGDEGGYGYTASASLASSAMTLEELGESEMFNPKPYWAKPINSDEQSARYVDSEGNFYNILGAQFIYGDNLETYGMFISEEDAATNMRLTKIERKIERN